MEEYVKRLWDRLESNKELQKQLYLIMQNAINEMHNSGTIGMLTGSEAAAVHDPDPDVRVREKTILAKRICKKFISETDPIPGQEGLSYLVKVDYIIQFANSITLCLHGGIEGLHMMVNDYPDISLNKYVIEVVSGDKNLSVLKKNIEQLDKMYDEFSIELWRNGKIIYPQPEEDENISGGSKETVDTGPKPHEKFLDAMREEEAFQRAFLNAKEEIRSILDRKKLKIKGPSGSELTVNEWEGLTKEQHMYYILSMGNYGIVPRIILCVDFVELIPYCLAIALLYMAYTGEMENQVMDTGDGADNTMLKKALELLQPCCTKWKWRICEI